MTATKLRIEKNRWGNYKAFHGSKAIAEASELYSLAHRLASQFTPGQVEFAGTYGRECAEEFARYF